jgi:hypothetical protein
VPEATQGAFAQAEMSSGEAFYFEWKNDHTKCDQSFSELPFEFHGETSFGLELKGTPLFPKVNGAGSNSFFH